MIPAEGEIILSILFRGRFWTVALTFSTVSTAALAHGWTVPVTPADVWMRWSFDPIILPALLIGHWLYGRGLFSAWARAGRGRIISMGQAGAFLLGELSLFIALVSPLDSLGDTILSGHMAQHILLTAIAPPLLLLGAPAIAFTWALPPSARSRFGRASAVRRFARLTHVLSRPLTAALIHGLVLWAWHAPALFELAIHNETLHTVEHLTFFGTALLVWWSVANARYSKEAIPAAGAIFFTFVQSGMLGGLLSLAKAPLYPHYLGYTQLWGLSGIQDQQLAGLIMWVPVGIIYLAAVLWLLRRALFSGRSALSASPSS